MYIYTLHYLLYIIYKFVCVYVYICICIYVYLYMYTYLYINATRMQVSIRISIYVFVCICVCVCMYSDIYVCIYSPWICIRTCTRVQVKSLFADQSDLLQVCVCV
jgi:hypothetical protein